MSKEKMEVDQAIVRSPPPTPQPPTDAELLHGIQFPDNEEGKSRSESGARDRVRWAASEGARDDLSTMRIDDFGVPRGTASLPDRRPPSQPPSILKSSVNFDAFPDASVKIEKPTELLQTDEPRDPREQFHDPRFFPYGYNIMTISKELGILGKIGFLAMYNDIAGESVAEDLFKTASAVYQNDNGKPPPEVTVKGRQMAARCEIKELKARAPLGGHGNYFNMQNFEDPDMTMKMEFQNELALTFTRDVHGNPYYKEGMQRSSLSDADLYVSNNVLGGQNRIFTCGSEAAHSLLMDKMRGALINGNSVEEKMSNLLNAVSGRAHDEILEHSRLVDLRIQEGPDNTNSISPPALKMNGDRSGNLNDKTIREAQQRLHQRFFTGGNDGMPCREYLSKLKLFLGGNYNQDAAYLIMQNTCKGEALSFLNGLIDLDIAFGHVWRALMKNYLTQESPEKARQDLLNLRYEKPTDLPARFNKIQKLGSIAAYTAPPATRMFKNIDINREEVDSMLAKWYPSQRFAISTADKKRATNWTSERKAMRLKNLDPDNECMKTHYHPWTTYLEIVVDHLRGIQPEERPKGYAPRRPQAVERSNKLKRRIEVHSLSPGAAKAYKPTQGDLFEEYAESIISVPDDDCVSVGGEVESQYGSEIDPSGEIDEDDYDFCDEFDDDVEVDALHAKPGEVMRRFQEKPRARPGERRDERREPRRDDRRDDRREGRRDDRRRDDAAKRGGNRETMRQNKDAGLLKRFPHINDDHKIFFCRNCGSTFHQWTFCSTYDGAKPMDEKRSCCNFYHQGPCKVEAARELDKRKKERQNAKRQQ